TRLDVAQANVQLTRARQSLLVAQNDRQNAIFALLNAIGADESAEIVLVDSMPAAEGGGTPLETARKLRPELGDGGARARSATRRQRRAVATGSQSHRGFRRRFQWQ